MGEKAGSRETDQQEPHGKRTLCEESGPSRAGWPMEGGERA